MPRWKVSLCHFEFGDILPGHCRKTTKSCSWIDATIGEHHAMLACLGPIKSCFEIISAITDWIYPHNHWFVYLCHKALYSLSYDVEIYPILYYFSQKFLQLLCSSKNWIMQVIISFICILWLSCWLAFRLLFYYLGMLTLSILKRLWTTKVARGIILIMNASLFYN